MCSEGLKAKAERLWAHVFNIMQKKIIFFSLFSVLNARITYKVKEIYRKQKLITQGGNKL